ncbi:DUF58 domain-containing protein [Candidatus Pacearchaeota archaeon]|nr:MAG: DUF58 domain-containing protein [Candidatus Pacearchaeota archaeon]
MGSIPSFHKGELKVNFSRAITEFEKLMQKLKVKNILYRTILRGRGLEFDSYREFTYDDDASLIDWSASLRANQLLSKVYIEERNLNVYFLVDVGNSMLFGSRDKLKAEYVSELIAALAHLVLNAGDKIGLIMFSDRLVKVLHPENSKTQFGLFMKFLSDSSLYGGGFDIGRALDFSLRSAVSDYSVFILFSDFINLGRVHEKPLRLLSSRFETMAFMVRDYFDDNLPDTNYQFAFQDPYSSRQIVLDPQIATRRFRESVLRKKAEVIGIFKSCGVDFVELCTSKNFVIPTAAFLMSRVGRRL